VQFSSAFDQVAPGVHRLRQQPGSLIKHGELICQNWQKGRLNKVHQVHQHCIQVDLGHGLVKECGEQRKSLIARQDWW